MLGPKRDMGFRARLVRAALIAALLSSPAVFCPTPSTANTDIARTHNFLLAPANSTASGVCDVCHAAAEDGATDGLRIFRYGPPDSSDIAKCGSTCHGGDTVKVYGSQVNITVTKLSHPLPEVAFMPRCFDANHGCHLEVLAINQTFVSNTTSQVYVDCLGCHNGTFMGNVFPGIAGSYDSVAGACGIANFTSMASNAHARTYQANSTSPSTKSCLKCHGAVATTKHPGGSDPDGTDPYGNGAASTSTAILLYPDNAQTASGLKNSGTPVALTDPDDPDYHDYQAFCLSCHDGRADAGVATAIQLNGTNVPAMPPYDYNEQYLSGGSRTFPSIAPYLAKSGTSITDYLTKNYFESNGHGRATSLSGSVMDLTCLEKRTAGGGTSTGCHSVHGSTNSYLIDDGGFVATTPPIDTPDKLGVSVCLQPAMGCHERAILSTNLGTSTFHAWRGTTDDILHAGTASGTSTWGSAASDANMEVGTPSFLSGDAARILPFYDSPSASLKTRRYYVSGSYDFSKNMAVACVSCHDPHGTADFYKTMYDVSGNPSFAADCGTNPLQQDCFQTVGMLRKFMTSVDFSDPLCSECHVKP